MKFSILLQYITPHRNVLLVMVGLLLAGSGASLVQPWLAGQLAQALLAEHDATLPVRVILGLWLVLMVLRALLSFSTRYYIGTTGEVMAANLRSRLFQHLQALPIHYHYQQRSGDSLSLLSYDAEVISSFVTDTLVPLLPLLLTFIGAFVMMALIDPVIACWALLLLPAFFVAIKIIGRKIRPLSHAYIEANSNFISFLNENLTMLPAVKTFVRESTEKRHFEVHNNSLLSLSKRQLLIRSLLSPAIGLLAGLGLLLLLWAGSARITGGTLSGADLLSLLLYAILLSQPLRGLADTYGQLQLTRGAAQRIIEFLSVQPEPDDQGLPPLPAVHGDIRFASVHFRYPGGNRVLDGLDFHIAAGSTVAITGPNGAGKSTIAHLLMRMADPDRGKVLIDDRDIAEVSLGSVRKQIGLVSQHTLLINATIAQNIAYGEPLVDRARIEQAAKDAHAHNFICQLPLGYDTLIGDQGLRLSGGQRQRLALARTLILDPPILILDEATSMFDPRGEEEFLAECRTLFRDKTVILITHRPASLTLAQHIIDLPAPAPSASSGQD